MEPDPSVRSVDDPELALEVAPLDRQLCFALYSASHAISASYRPGLDALGLTYSQYVVVLVLLENGPTTMSALSRRLHLDSGTLSPLLKRLEREDVVTRRRVPSDERSVEVRLTPAGERLAGRVGSVQADVERALGMDREQIAAMRTDLLALAERLRSGSGTPADA